ncbi:hypothetical protein MARPO_1454s0001 [Marchantia polymorpha]|uniref:Uncharacterized protein n=1 Tax=Marchantia polymorpha TaxID=3197 RepID=A0A2R6VY01_MARPO|nr:hypothetical protein MARPO_1454s0001 [Marchantia polymorpha]|eukprot:PTQ26477.1 hypothetical protein MARPO_1454s0001 [Marchantia polymorpha]
MLFHYDGQVDAWMDMEWSPQAIHVMAANQTKWWYAKRFLHPDIVARYNYIFLWDEDLGVENFHADSWLRFVLKSLQYKRYHPCATSGLNKVLVIGDRYLNIMEDEGLEISQPALASSSSEVHHILTVRQPTERVHRRLITGTGWNSCNANSTGPPCTGSFPWPEFDLLFAEQNDLVHAWGLDYKLGYCAQGVRSEKVGIIDSEYIVHEGIPSLGGQPHDKTAESQTNLRTANVLDASLLDPDAVDTRGEIRNRSNVELQAFSRRWRRAAASDPEWMDPFKVELPSEENHYAVETKPDGRFAPVDPSAKQAKKASRNKARGPNRTG